MPNHRLSLLLLALCLLGQGCVASVDNGNPVIVSVSVTGHLQHPELIEASGIAVSRRDSHVLWAINDNDRSATLYAMTTDGRGLAAIPINKATNVDWEDLASFELDGRPWLLVADIGDNNAVHPDRVLYVFAEPNLGKALPESIEPAWEIRYRYPDGPRDSEAAAVDESSETILVMSKRTRPAELYALPLRPAVNQPILTAKLLGPVQGLPAATAADLALARRSNPETFVWHWQPTAMDISSDGRAVVVLTYGNIYYWRRSSDISWQETLAANPLALNIPVPPEAEAIAFADRGKLFLTTEGKHAVIQQIDITP